MFEAFIAIAEGFILAYGLAGVFAIAVLESFIFPVPTAFILGPTTLFGVEPITAIIVATTGSIIGAIIGYFLGKYFGHPVAEKLFAKHIPRIEKWYSKYGAWFVLIAAFSPVPFKAATWFSGIFELDFKKFLLASIPGRLLQFIIVAYFGSWMGTWFF